MKCLLMIATTLPVICASSPLRAGKYNRVLSIGDIAPAWNELPGVDGKQHSMDDLADQKVLVVVFTCNSCLYSEDYEDRMIAIANDYAGKQQDVTLVAINVNTNPDDRLDKMKARATKKKFPFAYIHDESQAIGKAYGAKYTPEFFVLDHGRRVVYMGSMDDATDPEEVTKRYVESAVQAALAGKLPEVTETGARGCAIRYKRARRSKPK